MSCIHILCSTKNHQVAWRSLDQFESPNLQFLFVIFILKTFLKQLKSEHFHFFLFSMFSGCVIPQRLSIWAIQLTCWTIKSSRHNMLVFYMHFNICRNLWTVATFSATPRPIRMFVNHWCNFRVQIYKTFNLFILVMTISMVSQRLPIWTEKGTERTGEPSRQHMLGLHMACTIWLLFR